MPEQGGNGKQHEPEQLRKLFIGGLDYNTKDDGLKSFYEQWGTVVDVVVMKDPKTRRSRGFGFITYSDAYMVDDAMANRPHRIDGRQVEPKRAVPRDMCGKVDTNVRKLFIGGLSKAVEKEDLESYFGQFGKLTDCAIVLTKETGEKRGFGFVEYEDIDAADKVVLMPEHELKGRRVEVKKAIAREEIMRNERAARMAGVGRDRSNELHNRGRGGRDDYRGGQDSWSGNNSGNWGSSSNNSGSGGGGGSGGGSYQNPWGNNSGANWGGNMSGNAWNNPWGGQSGGFPQQGFGGNMGGMNPMMGMSGNMGGMGASQGGGYGGGYNSGYGTGGGYNSGNQAAGNSAYSSGGYGNSGSGSGYNSAGATAGGANNYSSGGSTAGGPMRQSYNTNRSAPYNTSTSAGGGGYGGGGNRGTTGGTGGRY